MGKFFEPIDLVEQVDVQDQDAEYTRCVCDLLGLEITCLGFGRLYGHIDNRCQQKEKRPGICQTRILNRQRIEYQAKQAAGSARSDQKSIDRASSGRLDAYK